MTVVTTICLVILAVAAVLCLARLLRPGSLADRIVALDTLLIVAASTIATLSVFLGKAAFVPVLLVVTLVAFVGSVTVARYIERRGA